MTTPYKLTPETLAELRRMADAATPGPWEAATGAVLLADDSDHATHVWYRRWRDDRFLSIGKVLDNELDQTTPEDAEYIAAANPAVVLALLDAAAERDALAAKLDAVREWIDRLARAARAWDEGVDFVTRHPGMSAEYVRAANPYRQTEGNRA